MRVLFLFFYLTLILFSPKLGPIDLKLGLIPFAMAIMVLRNPFLDYVWINICVILAFLVFYSFLIYLLNTHSYIDSLRYVRALLSVILIVCLFSSKLFTYQQIYRAFIYSLFLHVFIMYLMFIFPSVQPVIHSITGFDKGYRALRVSGLTAGFDIAGFITVVTAAFSYWNYKMKRLNLYLILFIASFLITFLTSRGNIIYIVLFMLYVLYDNFMISRLNVKTFFFLAGLVSIISWIVIRYAIPLFVSSAFTDISLDTNSTVDFYEAGYSKTNVFEMLHNFFILPDNFIEITFGRSFFPESDIGYIQTVNAIGIVGLVLTIYLYFLLFQSLSRYSSNDTLLALEGNILKKTIILLFILTLVASVKNQYLLTRGAFEMLIILIFLYQSRFIFVQPAK